MCSVKDINESKKRVAIIFKNGQTVQSEWFEDSLETMEGKVNTTKEEHRVLNELLRKQGAHLDDVESYYIRRYKDPNDIYISEHAYQRLKERNGWNKNTANRMIHKIYNSEEIKELEKDSWLLLAIPSDQRRQVVVSNNRKYILYGNNIYVFVTNVLVTVLIADKVNKKGLGEQANSRYFHGKEQYRRNAKQYRQKRGNVHDLSCYGAMLG